MVEPCDPGSALDTAARRSRRGREGAGATNVVPGVCGVCHAGCAVDVHLEQGRIVRLAQRSGHPWGIACARGTRAPEIVYSPDRLLYPQRRSGPKGSGRFERITWDEAYAEIVDRLLAIADRHGPEAVCVYTGRGNFELSLNEMFAPAGTLESSANAVLFPFGSPNTSGVGSLCFASYGLIAPRACFGEGIRDCREDVEQAELVLVWGANPVTDSAPFSFRRLKEAHARGARVVVIDHRRSETARALRCQWVGIRPGTDGALALGLLRVLIEEQLYDRDFVEHWTHGFEELSAYVQPFTPERVEQITCVPAETVVELARAIAAARGCSMLMYTGLEYSNAGVQSIRAAFTVQALAGHLDRPGGKVLLPRWRFRANRPLTEPPPSSRPRIGAEEFPLWCDVRQEAHGALLPRAILEGKPYPLRGLIVSGSSLITSWPDPARWRRAFEALDLLVVVDRFPTADSAYADIVLPATTMFEIDSYVVHENHVQLRRRIVPPQGESRNDYLVFAELARRLGYGDRWPQTEEEMLSFSVAGTGVDLDELRRSPDGVAVPSRPITYEKHARGELREDGNPGFKTPTGKFEIASEWFRGYGYEPLPVYTEPREGPVAAPEVALTYPLVLNTGARVQADFRSQHHNIPSLLALQPWPLVHLHTVDAEARGLEDDDVVEVVTARGHIRVRARVTEDIVRGVIEVSMGGGGPLGPEQWQEANVNDLTDPDNVDPISGFPVYKALLADVIPVPRAAHAERAGG